MERDARLPSEPGCGLSSERCQNSLIWNELCNYSMRPRPAQGPGSGKRVVYVFPPPEPGPGRLVVPPAPFHCSSPLPPDVEQAQL